MLFSRALFLRQADFVVNFFVLAALPEPMIEKLQTATFAILDKTDHPVLCGFFVTPCGVALSVAHNSKDWMRKSGRRKYVAAMDFLGDRFELDVMIVPVGDLDVAVLRLPQRPSRTTNYLVLPPVRSINPIKVGGAPVCLVHGNISWTDRKDAVLGQSHGRIVAVNSTTIHYDIATMGGHSGAALILKRNQVIGVHADGINDVDEQYSRMSPSTHGDAVRLDLEEIHDAVDTLRR